MGQPRVTTTSKLLEALRDAGNDPVWREFDARYRPIVTAFARRMGLSEEDAAEVAQQTLAEFARDYRAGKYERGKGRLGSWILAIAHHTALDHFRRRAVRREQRGVSAMIDLSDPRTRTEVWEAERRQAILQQALHILRTQTHMGKETIRAFELAALRRVPTDQVAAECGMTVNEVYVAKNRVTGRLREIVEELTAAYEEDA